MCFVVGGFLVCFSPETTTFGTMVVNSLVALDASCVTLQVKIGETVKINRI